MSKFPKIVLFLATLFVAISATAQYKRIVLVNKNNHLKDIFRLPHFANLNLVGDLPDFKNRVIIDSVNSETLFVSNPTNKSQQLIIPIKEIVSIHIPHRDFVEPIRILVGSICVLGTIAVFSADNNNRNVTAQIAAGTLYAGSAFSLFFSGPIRRYSPNNYDIKNTYK